METRFWPINQRLGGYNGTGTPHLKLSSGSQPGLTNMHFPVGTSELILYHLYLREIKICSVLFNQWTNGSIGNYFECHSENMTRYGQLWLIGQNMTHTCDIYGPCHIRSVTYTVRQRHIAQNWYLIRTLEPNEGRSNCTTKVIKISRYWLWNVMMHWYLNYLMFTSFYLNANKIMSWQTMWHTM